MPKMRDTSYLAYRKPTVLDCFNEHLHMENRKTGKEIKYF